MMGRITYIHHYFPALYFSIFMVPFLLEHFLSSSSRKTRSIIFGLTFALVAVNFIHFSPFSFGMEGDIKQYSSRNWFRQWNIVENIN